MTDPTDSFLGSGLAFPIHADAEGSVGVAQFEELIRQSILLIIGTAKGERVMRPTFGCGIHDLVFATMDATTTAVVGFEVRQALIKWEPRIDILDLDVASDPDEGNKLLISLEYRIRSTNNKFNLVYPFYLERNED